MRLSIKSGNLIDVLCRTLDQMRRMGIEVININAATHADCVAIQIGVGELDEQIATTLHQRVLNIPNVHGAAISVGEGSETISAHVAESCRLLPVVVYQDCKQ